jgi:hypothetical protein
MSNNPAAPANDHLAIWRQVEATDPQFTRRFGSLGGFEGTAVNPLYNIKRATEVFGPIGIGWGYEIVEERYIEGGPLGFNRSGAVAGRTVVHGLKVRLWYVVGDKRGEVLGFGQTLFVGLNGSGAVFTDEDAPKKSLTDAISKCLSAVGFSADVWLGRYDDSKYVASLGTQFPQLEGDRGTDGEDGSAPAPREPARTEGSQPRGRPIVMAVPEPAEASNPDAWIYRLAAISSDDALEHARVQAPKHMKGEALRKVRVAIDERQVTVWLLQIETASIGGLKRLQTKLAARPDVEAFRPVQQALASRQAALLPRVEPSDSGLDGRAVH